MVDIVFFFVKILNLFIIGIFPCTLFLFFTKIAAIHGSAQKFDSIILHEAYLKKKKISISIKIENSYWIRNISRSFI